jgi:hypothetical protein
MPRRFAPVRTTTAPSAAARLPSPDPGTTYDPNVIAIAAHDAVLPITKPPAGEEAPPLAEALAP